MPVRPLFPAIAQQVLQEFFIKNAWNKELEADAMQLTNLRHYLFTPPSARLAVRRYGIELNTRRGVTEDQTAVDMPLINFPVSRSFQHAAVVELYEAFYVTRQHCHDISGKVAAYFYAQIVHTCLLYFRVIVIVNVLLNSTIQRFDHFQGKGINVLHWAPL